MSDLNKEYVSPRFVTLDDEPKLTAKIMVIGVGGGGGNAVDYMISKGIEGVEYFAINTDAQVLENCKAPNKIQIGKNLTKGLGAGADPTIGKRAIEEDRPRLEKLLEKADMVFITAGMGGGTGTGAAPTVAAIANSTGALVIAIVTKPFSWEGKTRMRNAEEGINELRQHVDSLIVIPNERILSVMDDNSTIGDAFDKPNEILYEATKGISEIITLKGKINVDFADVRNVMNQSGFALMGCGIASGPNRATEAANKAISSPLLEGLDIKGAKKLLVNVTASPSISTKEIFAANDVIRQRAGEDADMIFGLVVKEDMNENVSYTVIATGFGNNGSGTINKEFGENKLHKINPRETIFLDSTTKTGTGFNDKRNYYQQNDDLVIKRGYSFKEDNPSDEKININSQSSFDRDNSTFLKIMMD